MKRSLPASRKGPRSKAPPKPAQSRKQRRGRAAPKQPPPTDGAAARKALGGSSNGSDQASNGSDRASSSSEIEKKRHGKDPARFLIVGLGASAGGLAALEQFFESVPEDSGMAYVVITHQAPDRTMLLPELLAKHAVIPVTTAADGMALRPNHVYVAPPGRALTVNDESLFLSPLALESRPHLPIDQAFRSLAHNAGDHAIGIVLSGNGSDGTLGIAEIKANFGMVIAQEPRTAQYTGMPASAIGTQLVDYVLSPSDMPEQLALYARGRSAKLSTFAESAQQHEAGIELVLPKILSAVHARTGSDFGKYKRSTVKRRIERRMHVHGIGEAGDYVRFLENTPYEIDALFKDLLISVTSFFRDAPAFEALEHQLAILIEEKPEQETLRAWIPACASGEEAYTIAIVLKEGVERSGKNIKVQIFATDLDQHAIELARAGRYPDGIAADLTQKRLERYFTREDGGYRVNKDLRELIVFAVQNIIRDPPLTKLDLISCRNLLIYLETELQKRALALFSYALRQDGVLLLGPSESISGFDNRFQTLDKRWKLFQRLPSSALHAEDFLYGRALGESGPHERQHGPDGRRNGPGVATLAQRALASNFVPTSIIVTERGELVYVHGRIGLFFEPAPGEPTQNVFSMAREGLRSELPAAVRRAISNKTPVVRRGLQVMTNGGFSTVSMTVRQLREPEALRGTFLVSFELEGETRPHSKKRESRRGKQSEHMSIVEDELRRTRENLQGTIEELETSNEELKSANEELQSTNEEMQSANEELETSREEMQSLNEELQTVNAELQERNRALSQTNDDMQNLLNSTDIATVFLDDKLKVKRFTTSAKKVFRLIDTDIGRPIADLAANLQYDSLVEEATDVLRTLVFREREIQTKSGEWRLMRIMPYRTHENLIDGLVMTFIDIDRFRRHASDSETTRSHT